MPLLGDVVKITQGNSKLTKKTYSIEGRYTAFSGSGPDGLMDSYEHEGKAIILSAVGARCGKCFKADGKWTAIANTSIIRPYVDEAPLFDYLFRLLNNEDFWPKGGTAQPFVQAGLAQRETYIPLPPLNEQRRIVAKLEEVLAKLGASQQRLVKIPVVLKRFRQAVLAAACSGRLTADWREDNPSIEPASALIAGKQFQISLLNDVLTDLPDKWEWVALGNYGKCSRGRFSIRPRNDPSCYGGEHPFIQIGNLPPDGGWIAAHSQTLNDKGLSVSKKFPYGTIAIAIVGATIGNAGLLSYEMCFPDSLVGIETGTLDGNKFVELYLRSRKDDLRQISYAGGGQPNIKLETLNLYPLALPPFPEQQEIVRRVESFFTLADQLEARYHKAKAHVDKLTQSILAKAFRGELVPQDPDDEPAAVLLERIRAERAKGAASSVKRRGRGANGSSS